MQDDAQMNEDLKAKLKKQGAERLADALLELAQRDDAASDMVDRLTATPEKNIRAFKLGLAGLKRSRRFIDWRESRDFARRLDGLLDDLEAGVEDPCTGAELVGKFFEADDAVLGRCDDSNGMVGDVFRMHARDLFVYYASQCNEKEKIAELILSLNRRDDYGVRSILIDCSAACLPEPLVRDMVRKLREAADLEHDEYAKRHHYLQIESLARRLKDGNLLEETWLADQKELPTFALIDIARTYLENGDAQTALDRLNRIPATETFQAHEREELLMKIYRQMNEKDKLAELLYRRFKAYPSVDRLDQYLDVVGRDKREDITAEAVERVMKGNVFRTGDVEFLLELGRMDDAEAYLLKQSDRLDGDEYNSLLPLAKTMESAGRLLAASIVYRSLLVSILERKFYKAYGHAARYLRKLDKLSDGINEWREFPDHESFKRESLRVHGRKTSFWSKYENSK